ncbi:hypothetical protein IWX79_003392 [Janthinobacterium sp. CAN_S1]|uniref:hypothetical protein n=1 Tax=Janthinobacterium sp. CAN_S7 TaxID=3071704 RepID=UPI001A1BA1D6
MKEQGCQAEEQPEQLPQSAPGAEFLFLNNQALAEHPWAWIFNCLIFPQKKNCA